jgi:hypothetical protein
MNSTAQGNNACSGMKVPVMAGSQSWERSDPPKAQDHLYQLPRISICILHAYGRLGGVQRRAALGITPTHQCGLIQLDRLRQERLRRLQPLGPAQRKVSETRGRSGSG